MGETLMVQRRVRDDGLRVVNLCHTGLTVRFIALPELTVRGSSGELRASSRGNTETTSVTRIHWA